MKDKIREWMVETGAAILIIVEVLTDFFSRREAIKKQEKGIARRETEEEKEEERVGELLIKKKEIIRQIAGELNKVKETSQIYASKKIINYIFGENGLKELNKKLGNLDERLMAEKKKDIEELKEMSGLLKADEEELRKKGIVMNRLYTIEDRILMMQSEMKYLFRFFDDKLKEENKILEDKRTFAKVLENSKLAVKHFKELNQIIANTRKNLDELEHKHIRKVWEDELIKKVEEISEMSMSMKERKELISYIRRNFVNPVKERFEGEDTSWLERLETKMMAQEHTKKATEWESRLEKAVWDLSDEMRKEWFIHKHLEKAFKAIDGEMEKLKSMIGYKKKGKVGA